VKGISLFLVPKFLPDTSGSHTLRNTLSVGALEKKMGIHAQPTCVMNYDGAIGWLVGEPNRGLAAMFTMMNAERLMVGIQGLGQAGGAYSQAAAYARERLQGRSADGAAAYRLSNMAMCAACCWRCAVSSRAGALWPAGPRCISTARSATPMPQSARNRTRWSRC
jgi:alkylation response protein AidB-like acyl-CoA dehydrogenase